jgi:hypothetical protein
MHYRVESAALSRARIFRKSEKAVAFAKALAEKTPHEVRVVYVPEVSKILPFGKTVLRIFNKQKDTLE